MEIVGPVLISTLHSWCPQSLSQTVKMPAIFLILYNCVDIETQQKCVVVMECSLILSDCLFDVCHIRDLIDWIRCAV